MKKKVFSKLLMVALVATVGAFTSCKDYDDDINDLRSKVDGLNTSLTTLINEKVTTVTQQVNALEKQLEEVKTAYAQADAALQKELEAAKETGKVNAENIKTLLSEVAELKAAKTSLEDAIKALQDGLATANANIKANGDNIITLLAKDVELEKAINEAKASAKNAFDEATKALNKANENATEIASLKTKEEGDFNNLQNQITKNLTDATAAIGKVETALNDYIKLNDGKVSELQTTSATNKADIATIQSKLKELSEKDESILKALDEAEKALQKADQDAAAAQKLVNDKLREDIDANSTAIQTINEKTIPQLREALINHIIPDEVAKQIDAVLEDRLQAFLESDVTDLVEDYYEKGVTIMQALDAKVDSIDEAINATMTLEFLLVAAAMDSIADAHDTKAGEIVTAYKAADAKLWEGIDSIGDLLETAKTTLGNNITTLNEQINGKGESKGIVGQIASLEEWFKPAGEGSTLTKLEKSLIENEEVIAKVNDIVAAADGEINSMITSINLFAGPHNNAHGIQDGTGYYEFDHDLNFTYAIEYGTVFPEPAMQKYVNDSIKFTEGYLRTYADSILVRVSPVNAVLDKDFIALINSQGEDIVASGIVSADSVKRYSRPAGQYLTRATNDGETGLWVIYFSLKDEDPTVWQKFKAAAYPKDDEGKYIENHQILYSVGVKNTKKDDAEDNRYVVSEYDLGLGTSKAFHAWDYNVVNGLKVTNVQNIHNRYIVNENKPNSTSAAKLWTDDQERFPESYNEELTYAPFDPYYKFTSKDNYPDGVNNQCNYPIGRYVTKNNETVLDIFGEKVVYDYPGYIYQDLKKQKTADDEELTFNVTDRWGYTIDHRNNQTYYGHEGIDNRDWAKILTVNFNGDWAEINIKFPRFIVCNGQQQVGNSVRSTEIGGFFVMLDQNFARESSTSEVSAWTQYIYEGVGFRSVNGFNTVTGQYIYDETRNDEQAGIVNGIRKATLFKGNEGTIKIKNARGAKGDVIGFRVYAVNLDGTLYDPEGRAFYVKVGDATEDRTLNFDVTVYQEAGDTATQAEDIVAFNKAADKAKTNQFFNMTKIELNKGSKYFFKWSWTEKDAQGNKVVSDVVRANAYNDNVYTPAEDESAYLSDLFRFWYTDAETVNKETVWSLKQYANGYETTYSGNVPVNNVAVELLDADRLLDNGIYHLKLEIFKEDPDGAKSQVNTIFVNVKKTMPNRPPKAFRLRDVQDKLITIYMRPKGENQNDVWTILGWFWNNPDLLTSANYKNYGFDFDYKVDGKTYAERWKEINGEGQSRRTRAYSDNSTDYRWATDVRPFNFEEIFDGLIPTPAGAAVNNDPSGNQDAYLAQFDQNYSFYFPGVGSYAKFQEAVDLKDQVKAVKDTAVTYFRTDEKMVPQNLTYRGLDTDKENIVEKKWPGYYMPYIYYENVKEDGKGEALPVMVAYTYRNISFKKNVGQNGNISYSHGDFTTKPTYFKADGSATDKAGSEFKVKFECAIDPKFEVTTMKDSVRSWNANDQLAEGINGTAVKGTKKDHNLDKAINYGNTFFVSFDSLTVAWKSDKTAMETAKNTEASYFRTNFAEFAQNKKAGKFPEDAKAYYQDTCWIWSQDATNYLVDKNAQVAQHVAIVGANVQPAISDIELYIYKTKDTEGDGEKADINQYFEVKTFASERDGGVGMQTAEFGNGAFGKYGLKFVCRSTSLDPTKIHRMRIVVKTAKTTLVHQWGHTTAGKQTSREIWVKNPASTPEIQGARRTR